MGNNTIAFILLIWLFASCTQPDPNSNKEGENILHEMQKSVTDINAAHDYSSRIYVPIYSDIYVDAQNQNNLLSATLSIRNTSAEDTLFISKLEYYNTAGQLVRNYLDTNNIVAIPEMGTINYVIEREDKSGGSGANFIIESYANSSMEPIFQAIMIGEYANKGFSFLTNGHEVPH